MRLTPCRLSARGLQRHCAGIRPHRVRQNIHDGHGQCSAQHGGTPRHHPARDQVGNSALLYVTYWIQRHCLCSRPHSSSSSGASQVTIQAPTSTTCVSLARCASLSFASSTYCRCGWRCKPPRKPTTGSCLALSQQHQPAQSLQSRRSSWRSTMKSCRTCWQAGPPLQQQAAAARLSSKALPFVRALMGRSWLQVSRMGRQRPVM